MRKLIYLLFALVAFSSCKTTLDSSSLYSYANAAMEQVKSPYLYDETNSNPVVLINGVPYYQLRGADLSFKYKQVPQMGWTHVKRLKGVYNAYDENLPAYTWEWGDHYGYLSPKKARKYVATIQAQKRLTEPDKPKSVLNIIE